MPNQQKVEKRVTDERLLAVHSIFLTIQGEGPFCGTPCVFVRLAGCNLQCPACDTDYTSNRQAMGPYEILGAINELWRVTRFRRGLVVITGGEPFRQNLSELFEVLLRDGYYVQVETNGTLEPSPCRWYEKDTTRQDGVYVVCSPKTPKLHPRILEVACALKYVVKAGYVLEDGLPKSALDMPNPPARPPALWTGPIYVQPLDEKDEDHNRANTAVAVSSCLHHDYTLQLQIHKIIGVE